MRWVRCKTPGEPLAPGAKDAAASIVATAATAGLDEPPPPACFFLSLPLSLLLSVDFGLPALSSFLSAPSERHVAAVWPTLAHLLHSLSLNLQSGFV